MKWGIPGLDLFVQHIVQLRHQTAIWGIWTPSKQLKIFFVFLKPFLNRFSVQQDTLCYKVASVIKEF